jgi:hypothetical protein
MKEKINKEFKEINTLKEYYDLFDQDKLQEVFEQIVDIRKFEIELYWKRASYFWTFNSAIVAGYILLATIDIKNATETLRANELIKEEFQFLLNSFGIIFSIAWYFVNRGSKFWQVNWERHMGVMEEKVFGSLYKTTNYMPYYLSPRRFANLVGPFPFSVSKINHLLNLFLISVWALLYILFIKDNLQYFNNLNDYWFFKTIVLLTLLFVFSLFKYGRTGKLGRQRESKNANDFVHFERRGFKENK